MNAAVATVADVPALRVDLRSLDGESERKWVMSTWSRCAKVQAGSLHGLTKVGAELWVDPKLVYRAHMRLVDELLPKCTVIVATLLVDPDPIGWAAFEGDTLHYVYVAPAARRCSIARQLALATRCTQVSHVTPEGMRLARCVRGEAR